MIEYGSIICLRSEYVGSGTLPATKYGSYSSAVVYGELFLAGKLAAGATAVGCPAPAAFSETLTLQPHATSPSLHFSSLLSFSLSLFLEFPSGDRAIFPPLLARFTPRSAANIDATKKRNKGFADLCPHQSTKYRPIQCCSCAQHPHRPDHKAN